MAKLKSLKTKTMKSLTDYTKDGISEAMDRHGAFFAFGNQFFEKLPEGKKPEEYYHIRHGLYCPKETVVQFMAEMGANTETAIQKDLDENGKENIIRRELANFECTYTGDLSDVTGLLANYGIERAEIEAIYAEVLQNEN